MNEHELQRQAKHRLAIMRQSRSGPARLGLRWALVGVGGCLWVLVVLKVR